MADNIDAVLDHVAVAVPDTRAALTRWGGQLGGGRLWHRSRETFEVQQLQYAGGGKLELIAPLGSSAPDDFMPRYLDRFGAGIHHVTLKVADFDEAVDTVTAAGLDVVDVEEVDEYWREGFLRPSQVGGLIVQIAWQAGTDAEWAARLGCVPQDPAPDAARLLGPRVTDTDLDAARHRWELLGASVEERSSGLVASWPNSPLSIEILPGSRRGPVALRFEGAPELSADAQLGAAVHADVP